MAIPFSQPLPWLAALVVFVWGAAIGGMNTGAVATYISDQALMLCIAAVGAVFAAMLVFRKTE